MVTPHSAWTVAVLVLEEGLDCPWGATGTKSHPNYLLSDIAHIS